VQPSQKEPAMGDVRCKNKGMLLEPFSWHCIESLVFACPIHENDQTLNLATFQYIDGFGCYHFCLKQNWIGIEYFPLNFFATFASVLRLQITVTFGSVLGLQVTVTFGSVLGLQVNSGLQPRTRWEQFVASTVLHRPEPTKESVEPTTLSTIAIEITHLTRFTLLLLLRILRYMWRDHVATWAQANDSGRNLDLNKIRFSHLHYILQ